MGYIAVDLDGTLAHYDGWKGINHIGEPVPKMLARVQQFLADGKEVRIFTARCWYDRAADFATPRDFTQAEISRLKTRKAESFAAILAIEVWCEKHLGRRLPVTCEKDFAMITLYDDRAVQVEINSGETLEDKIRLLQNPESSFAQNFNLMTARDFAFWLQGFFEIADPDTITPHQAQQIRKHLNMVFVHEIDPSYGGPEEQAKLNAVHSTTDDPQAFYTQNPHLKPDQQPGPGGAIARC